MAKGDRRAGDRRRSALKKFMEARELNANAWAKSAGLPNANAIYNLLRGDSQSLSQDTLEALAGAVGAMPSDLTGDVVARSGEMHQTVPLVGYVGAGSEVRPIDDHEKGSGLDDVPAPPGAHASAVAVQVRGDSMFPAYWEGDILIYEKRDLFVEARCLHNECVVELQDGRTFVKTIYPGSKPGLFTLQSYNAPPIPDVRVKWAAPVSWVDKTRRQSLARRPSVRRSPRKA